MAVMAGKARPDADDYAKAHIDLRKWHKKEKNTRNWERMR